MGARARGAATNRDTVITGRLYNLGTLSVLRFERRFAIPAERVWQAVATEEGLALWFPAQVDWEYRVGGRIHFDVVDSEILAPPGTITVIQRPRVFGFDWGGELMRFTISPDLSDATHSVLVFTHAFPKPDPAKFAAGWEICLRHLDFAVGGGKEPSLGQEHWLDFYRDYTEAFAAA